MRLRTLLFLLGGSLSAADFALRNGDTVVFYGDSITDQRLYTTFAETFAVTRFPQRRITFVHSGWGGDRVTGGGGGPVDQRLQRDVLAYKPSVVTIMLGMNDGRYKAFDEETFKTYSTGYEAIVKRLKTDNPNVRITVIQPSPYDDVTRPPTFPGGYNAVLRRYSDYLKTVAEKQQLTVADLNTPVVAMLEKANAADAANAAKILPDRVHPGAAGHLIMAEGLLKAWNAPDFVSLVEMSQDGTVQSASNTKVSDVQSAMGGLMWTQLDQSLPFPLDTKDPVMALAVRSSDFVEALNKQVLRIKGLGGPAYRLEVDGQLAGSFSAAELGAGVNLATLPTPMAKQAAAVHDLTIKRAGVHNTRWRQLQVPLEADGYPHLAEAETALDKLDADLKERQYGMAQPKPHQFKLIAAQK